MAWGMIIAWYLFLAGVSAGAYLTAHVISKKFPFATTIRKTGYYLAPPLLAIGLLLLIFDAEAGILHPLRFIYLLKNIPNSMMTNGTYIISIFMLITLYQAWKEYKQKEVNKWFGRLGVLFAIGTAAYTGLLIGVVNAVPLWNNSILPVLFTVSAISTGIAATVLTASTFDRKACYNLSWLKKTHLSLITLELFLIFIMFYMTSSVNEVAYQSVQSILVGQWSLLFWIGLIGSGLLIPMLIEGMELYHLRQVSRPQNLEVSATSTGKPSLLPIIVTELGVLIGGFILRYIVLVAAVMVTFF